MTIEEAVEKTIDECIKEGILADYSSSFTMTFYSLDFV